MESILNDKQVKDSILPATSMDEVVRIDERLQLVNNSYLSMCDGAYGIRIQAGNLLSNNGKIKLKRLHEALDGKKINLFDIDAIRIDDKIDITKIVNDDNDDKIDLFTYSTNITDGKVDLADIKTSNNDKIDVFKFNGIIDDENRVDFTKMFDSTNPYKIKYNFINTDRFFENGKLILSKIKISSDKGRIDLFDFAPCLFNGKIDQMKICNSELDDSIDVFKYTINHSDGKVDISKFTNSRTGKVDMLKFTGVADINGNVNLTKSCGYTNNLKINYKARNLSGIFHNGKLNLSKTKTNNGDNKIDIFNFISCLHEGKIDQSKLCNSVSDETIDIFKYTTNHSEGKIDLAKFTNSADDKINIYKFCDVVDDNGILDLAKIMNSDFNGKIYLPQLNFNFLNQNRTKLLLSSIKDSENCGKIDLNILPWCITDSQFDQAKICNSESDEYIDIFKYTINHSNGRMDVSQFTNSDEGKIDLFKFNGIKDEENRIDFTKIFDSNKLNKRAYRNINIAKFFTGEKLILSKINICNNNGKINICDFTPCLYQGLIDQSKICNSDYDDCIDIFKYTTNHSNGQIDLSKFTNSKEDKINIKKFNSVVDVNGVLDLAKITDSSFKGKINIIKINHNCIDQNGKILFLSNLKDSRNCGQFDLNLIPWCTTDSKFDQSKMQNSDIDDSINIFKYTTNHSNGKIDLAKFTNSKIGKINIYKFSSLIDDDGILNLAKITDSSIEGKIDINKINFKCLNENGTKLLLSTFKDNINDGKIDLRLLPWCITDSKFDQAKMCNSYSDDSIDIFKYTINHSEGKLDISKFTNSKDGKIDIFKFNGLIKNNKTLILEKVTINNFGFEMKDSNLINLDRFFYQGKLNLSKIKIFNDNKSINIFDFSSCIFNGKIDQSKLCNSNSDDSIDIFKYTTNHSEGKIDLAVFINSKIGKIDLDKFSCLIVDNEVLDLSKITDSSLDEQINLKNINFKCTSQKRRTLHLSDIKDSSCQRRIYEL